MSVLLEYLFFAGGVPMERWTIVDVQKFLTECNYQQYNPIFQHQVMCCVHMIQDYLWGAPIY